MPSILDCANATRPHTQTDRDTDRHRNMNCGCGVGKEVGHGIALAVQRKKEGTSVTNPIIERGDPPKNLQAANPTGGNCGGGVG